MSVDIILGIILFCIFGVCGIASILTKKVEKNKEDII
jgi:hypothetical protein